MAAPRKADRMRAPFPSAHTPTADTRRQVQTLAGIGLPQEMIARVVGVTRNTLLKYYEDDLETGTAKATANVAKTLYDRALKGDTACLIFWMKARAKWSERPLTVEEDTPLVNRQNGL